MGAVSLSHINIGPLPPTQEIPADLPPPSPLGHITGPQLIAAQNPYPLPYYNINPEKHTPEEQRTLTILNFARQDNEDYKFMDFRQSTTESDTFNLNKLVSEYEREQLGEDREIDYMYYKMTLVDKIYQIQQQEYHDRYLHKVSMLSELNTLKSIELIINAKSQMECTLTRAHTQCSCRSPRLGFTNCKC